MTAPVFNIRIGCAEASLQDRAFQPLEGLSVRGAGVPPVLGSGPDGSKLDPGAMPRHIRLVQGPQRNSMRPGSSLCTFSFPFSRC